MAAESLELKSQLSELKRSLEDLLPGKSYVVDAVLSCILSGGHLLLEDVPGVGKTTFIKGLTKLLNLEMRRIQFTSDLLPSDILGVQVYDSSNQGFKFHPGPIFANIVLADELNRASPKTQSALLEAMGERHVSVDLNTMSLPEPFFVIASQNPSDHIGTFSIPESQLDRFSIKIQLGYPEPQQEKKIFLESVLDPLDRVTQGVIGHTELLNLQGHVDNIAVSAAIVDCLQSVVDASRKHPDIELGISTRGGVQWMRLSKAHALVLGRSYVTPEDLLAMAPYCLLHRMIIRHDVPASVLSDILNAMEI
ncbi:MAG: MoxR family ATPase [Pseudobacteriovorax sp.]|nr:MoxR family ATPase [Pseudobacteriovorax sp.]